MLVVTENTKELILLNGFSEVGDCSEKITGMTNISISHYDPVGKRWSFSRATTAGWPHYATSEYDPLSGMVIVVDKDSLWTYDPVSQIKTLRLSINQKDMGYANNLVYFPPNQKMYYIARGNTVVPEVPTKVFEVTLNRTDWASSTVKEVTGITGAPYSQESGFAYDSVNQIIGGGIKDGVFYAYNPLNKTWTSKVMQAQSGSVGTVAFHALAYDPVDNVFLFMTGQPSSAYKTWAYRYAPGVGTSSPSTVPLVTSAITASGITQTSATITWTTDKAADSQVDYGLAVPYSNSSPLNPSLITTHSVTLSGLSAGKLYHYRGKSKDASGNLTTSADFTFTTLSTTPSPSGTKVGGYPIPSLQDEKNTYQSWGWTWTAKKEPGAVTETQTNYTVNNPDIHGDTEGDDLWSYLMMYRRTGNTVYLNRANAWARYFKDDYLQCIGNSNENFCFDKNGYGADHLYGWGLISLYQHSGKVDIAALTAAENIATVIEGLWDTTSPFQCLPTNACTYYGLRQAGRHLLFITHLTEVTSNPRWVTLRDKIINLLLSSPYWDTTRKMYFIGEAGTDKFAGTGAYAAGARIQSTFQIGILAEAFFHAYRVTGNPELKNRIVAMARFVDQYGLDPTYQYTGSKFGIVNGKVWHNYSAVQPVTFWDPVYTTDLVNTLVMGYKYTGDVTLLNKAKIHLNRGTKAVYGSPTLRSSPDNVVHHFMDTIFDSSSGYFYLNYNKGELQYTYLIFENGGLPTLETGEPPLTTHVLPAPTNVTVK
jgi:hypothetical protein